MTGKAVNKQPKSCERRHKRIQPNKLYF